ncbi:MAG: AAA family ATPase [Chloroflexi bacterium]|nr:AAA family ATPase [Chloroflexota bacterium]
MPNSNLVLNPFFYGKSVPPDRLIGRRDAVRTVFSRLYNGESTAIVGEPHIGKTSVLRYIAAANVRREMLGDAFIQHIFVEIDCQTLSSDFKSADLWRQMLNEIKTNVTDKALKKLCDLVMRDEPSSFNLDNLFGLLGRKGWRAVLLLDEFDVLLNHPNFNKPEFLGALRSLAVRFESLVVITATRISVALMNRKSQEVNPHGSPYFNYMTEVRILPLKQEEADQLLNTTLQRAHNGIQFSADDRGFLYSLAGHHPYLLQIAAASLYDVLSDNAPGDERHSRATIIFHARAAAHFEDFWRHLIATEQRALILLALAQYRGYVDGRSFDIRQLGNLDWYDPDLRRLRDLGMVESDLQSTSSAASWREANWRIAVGGIVPWLMDNVVSGTRDAKSFGEWLRDKEFQGLFTGEETKKIQEIASKIPKGAIGMAAEFVKSLFGK